QETHYREQRYTTYRTEVQNYQVPVTYCTYHPVYETQTRMVPVTRSRIETDYRTETRVSYTVEPVTTQRVIQVNTGHYETVSDYVPGPVVTRCVRLPGTCSFDPCTCTTNYCPGPVVQQQVQCPGRTVCRKVWVPGTECRTVCETHNVCRPVCQTVQVPVCRTV